MDVVFHCATAAPTGENSLNIALMEGVNIKGTENVIKACKENGVTRLVRVGQLCIRDVGQSMLTC
jgi:sterol-4alpha-carboxylate 3-dehydrogenase (decarboxylating)